MSISWEKWNIWCDLWYVYMSAYSTESIIFLIKQKSPSQNTIVLPSEGVEFLFNYEWDMVVVSMPFGGDSNLRKLR